MNKNAQLLQTADQTLKGATVSQLTEYYKRSPKVAQTAANATAARSTG
jgi:hypothetical protein